MWMLVCGIYIYGTMYGGPPYIVRPPHGCMTGQACRPPRAATLSLHIPTISWVRDTHSDSCPLSVEERIYMCVCVRCILLSIISAKGQATAVDTLTLLPFSSAARRSVLLTFSLAQFIFPNTAAEDRRKAGVWPDSREDRNGSTEEDREQRGWE